MNLSANEHPIDRLVRIVLGVALAAFAVIATPAAPAVYLVWIVAALALTTGIVGFCPLYALLRFGTARAQR